MSWKTAVVAYLLGGITLPPLIALGLVYLLFVVLPKKIEEETDDDLSKFVADEYQALKLTEIEERETLGVKAFRAGWLTVTREYHPFISNASDKQLEQKNSENKSAYTALYKLVKDTATKKRTTRSEADLAQDPPTKSNQAVSKAVRRKNRYYGVLRHGNLFLYKDENKKDVQHVVVLSNNIVTIWPRNLTEAELFTKKSSICVLKKNPRRRSDAPPVSSSASLAQPQDMESTLEILEKGTLPPKNMGFFIYPDTNYEKEDWYFDLIKATKKDIFQPTGTEFDTIDPSLYANPLHFKTRDIISLIQTLHSSEGQLQTRWLNSIIGRVFLSLQNTEYFQNIVKSRILKKLDKINKPGFLDDFQIKKVDVGNAAPFISSPRLVDLKPDGETKVAFQFKYTGNISLQVSTKANINLGGAFKTREVSLLLAVTLNKIEGPLLVVIKPPPSSRFWYTFEEMPEIDLKVEPIVSQRQISYNMINKVIEGKLRNAVKESLVEPYWDDVSFFNTSDEFYRGGIWDTKKRPDPDTHCADEEEKQKFDDEYVGDDTETIADFDSADLNLEGAISQDFNQSEETASLRSRETASTLRSRPSFNNVRKKTEPLIGTSNDQFLSNGSYVSKELNSSISESLDDSDKISRSRTMQVLSEEASAGKKTISNGLKKIGKWYEKNKSSGSIQSPKQRDASYKAPEMISKRRAHSNSSSDDQLRNSSKHSTPDLQSVGSNSDQPVPAPESPNSQHKTAPQAHSFPAEYLYGVDTKKPDDEKDTKNYQPSKIPEMMSPYVSKNDTSSSVLKEKSSIERVNYPKRKPVVEGEGLFQQESTSDGNQKKEISQQAARQPPPPLPERASVPSVVPPELPSRKPPPPQTPPSYSEEKDLTPEIERSISSAPINEKVPPSLPSRDIPVSQLIGNNEVIPEVISEVDAAVSLNGEPPAFPGTETTVVEEKEGIADPASIRTDDLEEQSPNLHV